MTAFTFRTWSAGKRTVEADIVEFTPTHVVFRNDDGRIVLADTANNVLHLEQAASGAPASVVAPNATPMGRFEQALSVLLNQHSMENESNTPDFILARYMDECLRAFERAVNRRAAWYGRVDAPGDAP